MTGVAVEADSLRRHANLIVRALGGRPADAAIVADALVDADLCGHRSHGVRQLPYYAGQIRSGDIDVGSDPEILADGGPLAVVDGRHGFGHVVAANAVEVCAELARRHRLAAVAVGNANHIGRLGAYTERLVASGHIALLFVNFQGGDQQLAPFGGIERRLTNNPLSIAAPGPEFPIVLDMALSQAAESRVLHAADLGAEVPEGWLLDADGNPSTDPHDYVAGGTLLPVGGTAGGHKGYALIVVLELVVDLLAGTALCGPGEPPFSNAFVLIALDPAGAATTRMDDVAAFVAWVKSSRVQHGAEILVPGELEARRRREADGIVRLDDVTVAQLDELAASLDVPARLGRSATSPPAS